MQDNLVLFFLDEAFFSGDKSAGSKLKSIITEKYQRQEPKFHAARLVTSCTSYNMATNDTGCIPGDPTDNRHLVLDVSEERAGDHIYFANFSERLKHDNYAGLKAVGWFLLDGWKISESFGETGQQLPLTRMMLIQRSNNFSAHEAFFDHALAQRFFVHPDSLVDNVYTFCPPTMRSSFINNVCPGAKKLSANGRRTLTFANYEKFPSRLHLFPNLLDPTDNAITESRYDPRDLTKPPKQLWSRVIALEDIMNAFRLFCNESNISHYGKGTNHLMMLQKMSEFLSPSGKELELVKLRKIASTRHLMARMTENVSERDLTYVILPPIFQCQARFQEMVGKSFLRDDLIDLENEHSETQSEAEMEAAQQMRRFQENQRSQMVIDYDGVFPYSLGNLCQNQQWPVATSLINPVTRMRRVRTGAEKDAAAQRTALAEIRQGREIGTMEQELQAWEVQKRRRVDPPPPPKPTYEIEEGDLAFLDSSLEDQAIQRVILEDVPVVVNNNNNNNNNYVVNDQDMLDDNLPTIDFNFDFPDMLLNNSFDTMFQ